MHCSRKTWLVVVMGEKLGKGKEENKIKLDMVLESSEMLLNIKEDVNQI